MSWLFLIVGILTLIALQWLRGVMSIIVSVPTVRIGQRPDAAQFGGFDLLDEAAADLAELGFGEPIWLHNEDDDDGQGGSVVDVHAVFPHTAHNVLAFVSPGVNAAAPRQLLIRFTTELDDGRQAVTQVGDPFYAALGDDRTPAQTVEPYNRAGEYRRHLEFIEELGAAPRRRPATARDALQFEDQHTRGIRQRYIDDGRLKLTNGHARPGFRLGLRILLHLLRMPKSKDSGSQPIPNERLRRFQRIARVCSNRAPANHVQWLLLGLSAVLFVGFGWPVFGLQITVILLAVVLFHEAGHWAAMRAFGYRNPHITLLPLLGGVAIGHESDPSAAKRAWVSLAGPLPGIILGWAMLLVGGDLTMSDTAYDWWQQTALFLLIVNYLNILPIPPLDGSHVLTALLPPRWVILQIIVLFAGVAIGFYLSWTIDFWLLAIIAGLQLLFVKSMWRNARLVRQVAAEPADTDDRQLWVLEQIEQHDGPATNAAKRLGQAEHVIRHIDLKPMGVFQRLLVSSVFVVLLVVPVGILALGASVLSVSDDDYWGGDSTIIDLYETMDEDRKRLERETNEMGLAELLKLTNEGDMPPPATEASIVATEERLGASLPDELRTVYAIASTMPDIGLAPAESIQLAAQTAAYDEVVMAWQYDGELYFEGANYESVIVDARKTRGWWLLSEDDLLNTLLFYDPRARAGSARYYLFEEGMASAHDDLRSLVRYRWIEREVSASFQQNYDREVERVAEELADYTIVELAEELPRPGWFARLLGGDAWRADPASEADLAALEGELGQPLPDDHRDLLTSDVSPALLGILPPSDIARFGKVTDESNEFLYESMTRTHDDIDPAHIERCWIVFGYVIDAWDGSKTQSVMPQALWCPELPQDQRYFLAADMQFYPSMTDMVRDNVVRLTINY